MSNWFQRLVAGKAINEAYNKGYLHGRNEGYRRGTTNAGGFLNWERAEQVTKEEDLEVNRFLVSRRLQFVYILELGLRLVKVKDLSDAKIL